MPCIPVCISDDYVTVNFHNESASAMQFIFSRLSYLGGYIKTDNSRLD
jgi:hypothetical protein